MNEILLRQLAVISFNRFHKTKTTVSSGGCAVYDFLIEKNILKRDAEQIKESIQYSVNHFKKVFPDVEEAELRKSGAVINRAKAICLDNFFMELKMNEESIEKYL